MNEDRVDEKQPPLMLVKEPFLNREKVEKQSRLLQDLMKTQSFQETLSLSPNLIQALSTHAYGCLKLERFDQALSLYRALALLKPDHYEYWISLALAATKLNKTSLALSAYEQAISLDPHICTAYIYRALVHMKLKNPTDAQQDFTSFEKRATPKDLQAFQQQITLYGFLAPIIGT